jgi:Protein of unknown function (DUF3089)
MIVASRCQSRTERGAPRFGAAATRRTRVAHLAHLLIALCAICVSSSVCMVAPANAEGPALGSSTVWLCKPGAVGDPCTAPLTTTVVRPNGSRTIEPSRPAKDPPIDCFYVYPTVSRQTTVNANLHIDPEERAVARAQASRFSQVCRMYAPMYPQLTRSAIGLGGKAIPARGAVVAYLGLLSAWEDYLAHYNHGRGVVLIGHSQGASLLIALMRREIDPNTLVRRHLVSALLMGGNVTVPIGADVGGDFQHIPACRSNEETGCVVAYSSFDEPPPSNSLFGRVGTSIAAQSGLAPTSSANLEVLCTNPADLAGGPGRLEPYLPTSPFPGTTTSSQYGPTVGKVRTPWVTFPRLYSAQCESSGGASWLQVNDTAGPKDRRPVAQEVLGPRWGLHLVDVNLALGNLVNLVRDEAAAYER